MHTFQVFNNVVLSDAMVADLVVAAFVLAVVNLPHYSYQVYHSLALHCHCAPHVLA